MFTVNHFIWLGAIALLIALALITLKKINATHGAVGKGVMAGLIVLKLFHVALSMKESEYGGYIVNQTQLSFHLCSIMIYTIIPGVSIWLALRAVPCIISPRVV